MFASPTLPLEPRDVWTVSELLAQVKQGLEADYPAIWVRGEISNLRRQASGHWYFNLKDDAAVLNVAMFRGDNVGVPFRPEDGLEVTAVGRLTLFERAGRFQLIANLLEPVGWGAQQLAFEQLKKRLEGEGLFADDRKLPLPLLPSCVGVVTSSSGAAWRDMTRVWQRRGVGLRVILCPSRVQGAGAAAEIAAAIDLLGTHAAPEVIVVGRGGGSREDLWAFNEEPVARALDRRKVPIISAVGHEIDVTIADLCADRRAATPTAAAEIVAPANEELTATIVAAHHRAAAALQLRLERATGRLQSPALRAALARPARNLQIHQQRLDTAWEGLGRRLEAALQRRRRRLDEASDALARADPLRQVQHRREILATLAGRLRAAVAASVHDGREHLGTLAARTEAMSPLGVLGRGYALCHDSDGALLRSTEGIHVGDRVGVRLAAGHLDCAVREIDPDT